MLPRATAPMGNMMRPGANTDTTRLGTEARRTTRKDKTEKRQDKKIKNGKSRQTKPMQNTHNAKSLKGPTNKHTHTHTTPINKTNQTGPNLDVNWNRIFVGR